MIHLPSLPGDTLANSVLAGMTRGNRESHRGGQGYTRRQACWNALVTNWTRTTVLLAVVLDGRPIGALIRAGRLRPVDAYLATCPSSAH